jgi:bis(5'-nucleosidyl)-tetraphosphatase
MNLKFGAGVCIVHNGKILLLRETDSGHWGPPAGHANPNEDLIQTAIRETKEETNLDITVTGLVQATFIQKNKDVSYIALFYSANVIGNLEIKIQEDEISEYAWVSEEELEENRFELRDRLLKNILIKALNENIAPLDSFQILKTTEYK